MKFEEILEKLKKISEELEKEDIPLEKALELYEEGVRLSKMADEILSKAETRIKKLDEE